MQHRWLAQLREVFWIASHGTGFESKAMRQHHEVGQGRTAQGYAYAPTQGRQVGVLPMEAEHHRKAGKTAFRGFALQDDGYGRGGTRT